MLFKIPAPKHNANSSKKLEENNNLQQVRKPREFRFQAEYQWFEITYYFMWPKRNSNSIEMTCEFPKLLRTWTGPLLLIGRVTKM